MDKGIPLPELPFDPPKTPPAPPNPRAVLLHGIVWTAFGLGGVATLLVTLPMAAALSALLGPDVGMGRGVLVAAALGTYLVAFVAALLRGSGTPTTPPMGDGATT